MKVSVVKYWGSEEEIIESARMSTGKGFEGWEKDQKLLTYLYSNNHLTPFEMVGATFEVEAPIFVMREWMRHRTQSYNELSARYVPIPDDVYIPLINRCLLRDNKNKQAQGLNDNLTKDSAQEWLDKLAALCQNAQEVYEDGLVRGIPKEIARLAVTVGRYSKMRASTNLRNWLQFLTLRCAPSAQYEIRYLAWRIYEALGYEFPRTINLWRANNEDLFDGFIAESEYSKHSE